ncbi:unnamed protein product [Hermetia illucens]|uniref:Uncharacterized protein n=1 Tax=Hermetia illucens TaxID=343691 RepID=A0A7R8UBS5_HERIL|nr:unnamed protein product [Hermetia illucens]
MCCWGSPRISRLSELESQRLEISGGVQFLKKFPKGEKDQYNDFYSEQMIIVEKEDESEVWRRIEENMLTKGTVDVIQLWFQFLKLQLRRSVSKEDEQR